MHGDGDRDRDCMKNLGKPQSLTALPELPYASTDLI